MTEQEATAERELRERCLELATRTDAARAVQLAAEFLAFVKGGQAEGGS